MIKIRKYKALDEDFIYHSWLSSVDYNIPGVQKVTRLVIDSCADNGTILIACSDEDPDHILGWLSYSEELGFPIALYTFVKKHLRNHGIGASLIKAQFTEDTIPTAYWSFWCQKYNLKKKWGLKFNSLYLPVLVDKLHGKAESNTSDKSQTQSISAQA
tara:strand:- start:5559 stop:6032 length:474 start_codon:yes stop_codon:yes gene_type:complete